MFRVRKCPSANCPYDAVSNFAFVTGQNRIWKRMFGVPRSLAIRLTTAAMMAKDRGTPNILFQILFWPVTNAKFDTASYGQFAEGHFLTRNMMRWFWDCYTTDPRERQDVYASPLQASNERLEGLPPALIQTAEMDVLPDEGEAYARKLDGAGVDVTATRYNGLIHDYGLLNAISQVPGVRSALLQASQELKRRLQ